MGLSVLNRKTHQELLRPAINAVESDVGLADADRSSVQLVRLCKFAQQSLVLALGFFVPLSTTISNALVAVYLVLWLASGDWRFLIKEVRANRVSLAALAMFALLGVGTLYSIAPQQEAYRGLMKYRELLYVPMLASVLTDPRMRRRALTAFLAGVGAMLLLSYIELILGIEIGLLSSTDRVIFKDRIIHCLLVAFFVYVLGHQAVTEPRGWRGWGRWLRIAVIAAALINMFVLVQGRTGQMIVTLLFVLFVFQHRGLKGCLVGGAVAAMLWGAAYLTLKPVQVRMQHSLSQLKDQFGPEKKRNLDGRLEFYELSLAIVRNSPLIGMGTGGFPRAYEPIARERNTPVTADPHNEYLMLAVQLGVIGPLALLALLGVQWYSSRALPVFERRLAQGMVVVIAAGCLVNSLMHGFTGGLFWGYFSALAFSAAPATGAEPAGES